MFRLFCLDLLTLALTTRPAAAQVPRIIVEGLADIGRIEGVPTAQALALGATRLFGGDNAADAARNPAALIRGPRADLVAGMTNARLRLERFVGTHRQGLQVHEHRVVAGPWTSSAFAAGAVRRQRWAVGAFYDGSARFRHDLTTGDRTIRALSFSLGRGFTSTTGRTSSSAAVDRTRAGAAIAIAIGRSLTVGVGVEASRLHADVRSVSDLLSTTSFGGRPLGSTSYVETSALTADDWASALTLAASWQPTANTVISSLWHRLPPYTVALESRAPATDGGFVGVTLRTRVSLDVPDVVTIGAATSMGAATVTAEVARVDYEILGNLPLAWPDNYAVRSSMKGFEARGGMQFRFPAPGSSAVLIRAGAWSEAPAGLARGVPGKGAGVGRGRPGKMADRTRQANVVLDRDWIRDDAT